MTQKGTLLVLLGILLSVGASNRPAPAQVDTKSIEQAVLAVSAEMTKAGESADADRLFSYMLDTDKGSVIQNGVFFATRQEALERVRSNLARANSVQYRWKRQYVTVLSPQVALLTAEGEAIATRTSGETITTPLAQTIVFVLRADSWKAIHAHQSVPLAR